MRNVNRFFIAAAASIAIAASPAPVFAHGRAAPAHIISLGSGIAVASIARGARGISARMGERHNRSATPFASFPWDWSYGSYAIVAPPAASGFMPVMMRAPISVAELPRCHESVGGVSIVRGKSCRT